MLGFVAEARSTEIIIDRGEPKTPGVSRGDWLLSDRMIIRPACRASLRSPAA